MSKARNAAISVRDLTKRYGDVQALESVSFEVETGEIFGLLGPNGAGKTTALECLLGLRKPDGGTISINGIDAIGRPAEAKRQVGAQLQSSALQDKITPREALALFASFYRQPADVAALLERFSLESKADAPFASLSGGQRQRVFLALAFVNDPQVVVLDEPTAGLDPASRRELHEAIGGLRRDGHSVLLSTHHLDEAEQLCDHIGILDRGRLVAVATPQALIAQSRSQPRLVVATLRPISAAEVAALPAIGSRDFQEGRWTLGTSDPGKTITSLMRHLDATRNGLVDLQVRRPSLEDVFLELTGRPWIAAETEKVA